MQALLHSVLVRTRPCTALDICPVSSGLGPLRTLLTHTLCFWAQAYPYDVTSKLLKKKINLKENIMPTQELAKAQLLSAGPWYVLLTSSTPTQKTQPSMEPLFSLIYRVHTVCTLRKKNMGTKLL